MADVVWLLPHAGRTSGGLATALAHARALERSGHTCRFWIPAGHGERDRRILHETFGIEADRIVAGGDAPPPAEVAISTTWQTAEVAARARAGVRLLFAQDWEPAFWPAGDRTLRLERVLSLDIATIALGHWLGAMVAAARGTVGPRCELGADPAIYSPGTGDREDAVCLVIQPGKHRRAPETALATLAAVKRRRPVTTIYLFGDERPPALPFAATWLGFLPPRELAALYRRCRVGLCLSATNPSRIPFEMMACGLPVVELYRTSNLFDLPARGCRLAFQSHYSLAYALLLMLDNPDRAAAIGAQGAAYMRGRTRAAEEATTVDAVARALAGTSITAFDPPAIAYDRPPVVAPGERRAGVRAFVAAELRRAAALAGAGPR